MMSEINAETLTQVLSQMLGTETICADIQTKPLHGGTVGNVQLVTGHAQTTDGSEIAYNIVVKTQKKWERYRDPD